MLRYGLLCFSLFALDQDQGSIYPLYTVLRVSLSILRSSLPVRRNSLLWRAGCGGGAGQGEKRGRMMRLRVSGSGVPYLRILMRICEFSNEDWHSTEERWRDLFGVTSGRPSLFHVVMEWGTPWIPASLKRGEQRRGEASPVHNHMK